MPTVAAPDAEAVVGLLVETHKRNKTSVLCGVNAVARGLGQLALVVVCGEGAPPVLTQHLVEGSQAAQCRLVTLPVTAEAMGRALGVRRVLALGVRRDAVEAGSLLATVGAVPGVFWLPPGPVSYLPLKIGTTESKATPEAYAKRVQRKQEFAQKQIRLRQKRDEERRAKKGLKDGKNVKAPRGRGRKKAKQEAIEQWLAQTKKPAKIIAD